MGDFSEYFLHVNVRTRWSQNYEPRHAKRGLIIIWFSTLECASSNAGWSKFVSSLRFLSGLFTTRANRKGSVATRLHLRCAQKRLVQFLQSAANILMPKHKCIKSWTACEKEILYSPVFKQWVGVISFIFILFPWEMLKKYHCTVVSTEMWYQNDKSNVIIDDKTFFFLNILHLNPLKRVQFFLSFVSMEAHKKEFDKYLTKGTRKDIFISYHFTYLFIYFLFSAPLFRNNQTSHCYGPANITCTDVAKFLGKWTRLAHFFFGSKTTLYIPVSFPILRPFSEQGLLEKNLWTRETISFDSCFL